MSMWCYSHRVHLVARKEVWQLARVEEDIDVFEKRLFLAHNVEYISLRLPSVCVCVCVPHACACLPLSCVCIAPSLPIDVRAARSRLQSWRQWCAACARVH